MEQIIYSENTDRQKAALQKSKRAYVNTIGAELGKKYLAQEGFDVSNVCALHDMHKILEEFDIADIILENIRIDVRVVYDENLIFVPKSHFEWTLVPDIYLVFLMNEPSHVKFLGFFEPRLINKNNKNNDYYFIEKEKLTSPDELRNFVQNFSGRNDRTFSQDETEKAECLMAQYNDGSIGSSDKKELFEMLLQSSDLRRHLAEFDNFERIAFYNASSDELDNISEVCAEVGMNNAQLPDMNEFEIFNASDVELAENSVNEPLSQDMEENFEDSDISDSSEDFDSLGVFDDQSESEESGEFEEAQDLQVSDESEELTDNNEKEDYIDEIFSDINYEQEEDEDVLEDFTEEEVNEDIQDSETPDESSDEELVDGESLNEENATDLEIVEDIPEIDENFNLDFDEVNDSAEQNGDDLADELENFDADLEKIEDLPEIEEQNEEEFEKDLENFDKVEEPVEQSEEEFKEDLEQIQDFEIQEPKEENFEDDLEKIEDLPEFEEQNEEEFEKDLENFDKVEEPVEQSEEEFKEDLEQIQDFEVQEYQEENEDDLVESFDDIQEHIDDNEEPVEEEITVDDTEKIPFEDIMLGVDNSSHDSVEVAQNVEDVEEDTTPPVSYENSQEISNENMGTGEIEIDINKPKDEKELKVLYNKTDDILTSKEIYLKPQEFGKKAIITASVVIAALVSLLLFATLHKTENKTEPTNVLEKNIPQTEEQPVPELPEVLPSQEPTQVPEVQQEQKPAVNPTAYTEVKKLGWAVPDYLSYNDAFKDYLQTAGKSLRLSLSSDLLLATEYAYSQEIKVNITITKEGTFQSAKIEKSSGSKQIDDIVLRTVNETLKVVKAPSGLIVGNTTNMILKIYL